MVNVVVGGIIREDPAERVVWEFIAAVVQDGLDGRSAEEEPGLSDSHTGDEVGKTGAKCVKEEALEGMVVESTVGVRYVQSVVTGVEGNCDQVRKTQLDSMRLIRTIEPLVQVHGTVQHVLPRVDDENTSRELQRGNGIPVESTRDSQFPRRKSRCKRLACVMATSKDAC